MASSTVMTPSLPTFSIALAMISPISMSPLAEIVPTWPMSLASTAFFRELIDSTAFLTAMSMPLLISIGLCPAVTILIPSR